MIDIKNLPVITVPQIVAAIVGAVGPVLLLLGVDLDVRQLAAVDDLKVIALGLFGADALVRAGRSVGIGLQNKNANVVSDGSPPTGVVK